MVVPWYIQGFKLHLMKGKLIQGSDFHNLLENKVFSLRKINSSTKRSAARAFSVAYLIKPLK